MRINCLTQRKNPDTKPSKNNISKTKVFFHAYKKVLMHKKSLFFLFFTISNSSVVLAHPAV